MIEAAATAAASDGSKNGGPLNARGLKILFQLFVHIKSGKWQQNFIHVLLAVRCAPTRCASAPIQVWNERTVRI